MELTETLKDLFIETGKQLKGSARRLFMARTVKALGLGGASRAEQELGWNRKTIRKGMHEALERYDLRGRVCFQRSQTSGGTSAQPALRYPSHR